jgi:hypothetical protein
MNYIYGSASDIAKQFNITQIQLVTSIPVWNHFFALLALDGLLEPCLVVSAFLPAVVLCFAFGGLTIRLLTKFIRSLLYFNAKAR